MLLVLFIIFQSFLKGLSHEGTSLFETNKQTLISLFQSQDSTVQEIGLRDFFNFLLGLKKTKYNLNVAFIKYSYNLPTIKMLLVHIASVGTYSFGDIHL